VQFMNLINMKHWSSSIVDVKQSTWIQATRNLITILTSVKVKASEGTKEELNDEDL